MLRKLALLLMATLLTLLAGFSLLRVWWQAPLAIEPQGFVLQVEPGDSLSRISRHLEDAGVLRQARLFNLLGRLSGADSRIRRGEYLLRKDLTPRELLPLLQSGDTVRYLVTLPEGIRLRDAVTLIAQSEGIVPVLEGADDPRLLALVAPATVTEGFFLPETYQYQRGDSELDVLVEAHRMMQEALADAWEKRQPSLPYGSPYDALIMASIIEKETAMASERTLIGGVFARRLQRGMRLQTDPTVIYGLGDAYSGNLQRVHLKDKNNAYNSYRHAGLPPGPIALPGRAALMAAVQPAAGDALYFVARGDGSHEFNANLDAHEEAVRRFQLRRRADYRSTPKDHQQ